MIRVLIVEDSPTVQQLLEAILHSDPEIQVIGTAPDGQEAVHKTMALRPDLVTMDLRMPGMDGLEATRQIMDLCPTPIVIVSAHVDSPELPIAFSAIRAGALDVVRKPLGIGHAEFDAIREELLSAVKLMAGVHVIGRKQPRRDAAVAPPAGLGKTPQTLEIVAIGASTGGPAALKLLFDALPFEFPVPIVVVQHIAPGFLEGLVDWLQSSSALQFRIAAHNERIVPGSVYFAPPNCHLVVRALDLLGLDDSEPVSHVRPSATVLFQSLAATNGARAAGVLLTGMGDDGAKGLRMIREQGGATLVQNEATSVVWGMPKAAIAAGAADYVLPLADIAPTLLRLAWEGR